MDVMSVFLNLVNVSISACFLVFAVIAFRLIFKKAPKAITVFLWALVAIRLICPISIESTLSLVPNAETIPTEILSVDPHKGINSTTFEVIENPVYSEYIDSEVTVDSIDSFQWDVVYLTCGWLCGMAAMVLYSIISYLSIYLKIRQSLPLRENIFICDTINTPFIFGIIRPRIYLPSSMGEEDMTFVIAHEKAHLKRKDYLWKPLGFLLLTVYWFNPVLWVAYVLLCRDIELACDEKVIKEMGAEIKKPYSMALINCSVPRRMISACPVAFGEVGVKKRIKAVLNYKKPAFWVIIVAVVASIAVAVCFMTNPVSEKTEVKYEWYCNPSLSAVGYSMLSFSLDEDYVIESAECTGGTADIYDKYYDNPTDVKYVGWSPDFEKPDEKQGADITIHALKDGEKAVFSVKVTPSEENDDDEIGTYFSIEPVNCTMEEDGWAWYVLSKGKGAISEELDEAVSKAILDINSSKKWIGECPTEGHIILGTEKDGNKVTVYMIENFSIFSFENGWFIETGGHRVPAVMTFEKTDEGYKYLDVEYAKDGSEYAPSIKKMFPGLYERRAISPTKKDSENMWNQCVAYAEAYLKEIGREAKIGTYGDVEHILLTDLGVSVEVSNKLSDTIFDYNSGVIGFFEKIEDGVRYIYRTSYLADKNIILYTKEVYDTNEIVEKLEVDSLTGNIVSSFNSPEYMIYFDAKVLDVEKNGDFVLVEPFENTNERKTADRIWVSLNVTSEVPVPDVYEGLYIRIMYDGIIQETYPAKIPNVSAIYLYADVNYIGNEAPSAENKEPTTNAYYIDGTTKPLISVGEAEKYCYTYQSDTGDISSLYLSSAGKRFEFSLSLFSSYLPVGTYEENDEYVILKTDGGKNTYTFEKSNGNLIFVAEKSSPVPEYKYGENQKAVPCIRDKAVFEFIDTIKPYFDKISADIDNDGIIEDCTLGFGPTSGLLTFTFDAYENGEQEYFNIFLETGSECYWEFEESADGKIRVISKEDEYGSVIRKYDINIKYGNIELVSDGKSVAYFGSRRLDITGNYVIHGSTEQNILVHKDTDFASFDQPHKIGDSVILRHSDINTTGKTNPNTVDIYDYNVTFEQVLTGKNAKEKLEEICSNFNEEKFLLEDNDAYLIKVTVEYNSESEIKDRLPASVYVAAVNSQGKYMDVEHRFNSKFSNKMENGKISNWYPVFVPKDQEFKPVFVIGSPMEYPGPVGAVYFDVEENTVETKEEKFRNNKTHFTALADFAFAYYTDNKPADGAEITLMIANGKLKKLDDNETKINMPDSLNQTVAAIDDAGYDWLEITEDYVVFWTDELSNYGLLYSETPLKSIRKIKKDGYSSMQSNKIEKNWYEIGILYG